MRGQAFDAAPYVIPLLSSGNVVLAERSAWVVANIAGDSGDMSNRLIACGAVSPLVALCSSKVRVARSAVVTCGTGGNTSLTD